MNITYEKVLKLERPKIYFPVETSLGGGKARATFLGLEHPTIMPEISYGTVVVDGRKHAHYPKETSYDRIWNDKLSEMAEDGVYFCEDEFGAEIFRKRGWTVTVDQTTRLLKNNCTGYEWITSPDKQKLFLIEKRTI